MNKKKVLILGAGPAGLTSAYQISKHDFEVLVVESDPTQVGGLSKTINHNGNLVDIGGHRFYTKASEVAAFWKEILPNDFVQKNRHSRIYYNHNFFDYPLKPFECFNKLSAFKSLKIIVSFLVTRIRIKKEIKNLEDWFINKFGRELYKTFFKSYTEKVWGKDCHLISSDWAAQRIQDLTVYSIFKNAFLSFLHLKNSHEIKTLTTSFLYPRLGPGMLWDECYKKCVNQGVIFYQGAICNQLRFDYQSHQWQAKLASLECSVDIANIDYVISSIPIPNLMNSLNLITEEVTKKLISKFQFRDFIMVLVVVTEKNRLKDNWIYIHDENVKVGRIQIFNNWSADMVVNSNENTSFGLEYFCQENEGVWNLTDQEIGQLAQKELLQLGLVVAEKNCVDYKVIKIKKAYPVYHLSYKEDFENLKKIVFQNAPNVFLVGRNGMHRYNNQDHSIMTSLIVANNIIKNEYVLDPWKVNQDAVYIEMEECSALS